MGPGGPWWAMGLKQKPRLCCRFFLGDWLFVNPNNHQLLVAKDHANFRLDFILGISTHVPCVVDNVYRHNSVSIKSSITPIKSNVCILIICQAYLVRFFPIFNPHNFFQPKNLTQQIGATCSCPGPSDRPLGLLESAVAVRCSWRRREKIGALVGQRFWTTPMCSLDIDMIIYIHVMTWLLYIYIYICVQYTCISYTWHAYLYLTTIAEIIAGNMCAVISSQSCSPYCTIRCQETEATPEYME